jgi:aminomethyltransferase
MWNVPHAATAVRRFVMTETALKRTPLYDEHVRLGAKLVPFAGFDMPVQYPSGIMAEHKWTREHAGLFDVSHMGQCLIVGSDFETVARAMETLVPADIAGLHPQQQRYSQLLNDAGGTIDDLMISRTATNGQLYVVVNAGRKDVDYAHIDQHLPPGAKLVRLDDKALVALQGPEADAVLTAINPAVQEIPFMTFTNVNLAGIDAQVSRSGYSGEDGFEISVAAKDAGKLWTLLLSDDRAKPVGLGARDSLRLEAGLCLYGHELDETISPIEAGLLWSIGKRRRSEGGFIGANHVLQEIANGTARKRVGIKPDGRAPARDGTIVQDMNGRDIGKITSGGFGPSVNGPIAMGYVEANSSVPGTSVRLVVRGQAMPATIVKLPFVPNNFKR